MKKKRRAPPPPPPMPPAPRFCEDVQNTAFHKYNAYEVISIQTHTYREITYPSDTSRRLSTFCSDPCKVASKGHGEVVPRAGKSKTKAHRVSAPTTKSHGDAECSCPTVEGKSSRGTSKRESLKVRKNNSHVSIFKRNMEAGTKTVSRAKKEAKEKLGKVTKEPTYEDIEDYLNDNQNVMELAALLGEKLDHALRKPTVSESCASPTKNKGKSSTSNKQLQARARSKKSAAGDVNGSGRLRVAVNAKENFNDCNSVCSDEVCCDAKVTPQSCPPQGNKGKHSREVDSNRQNGNIKTYIFGEQPATEPTKKKTALKERQCHLASPESLGRGHKARDGHARVLSTGSSTEKRQKRGSSAGFLRTSFKASARRYKDNVVHTHKRRHPKHDKHHDAYGSAERHFVHQIPRVIISCENLTESRKAKSLSKIRDSFRGRRKPSDPRPSHIQESDEESANEHSRRSRPRDAKDFLREENESPERRRANSRSHSSTREDRRASYGSLERSKSVHAKRRTPRRDSPALSDDLYVRRKSRGPRIDLAKMR